MLFQMCGVFAEFERAIISERVRAGLERVRANGQGPKKTSDGLSIPIQRLPGAYSRCGRGNGPAEDRAQPRDRYQLGAATRRGGVTRRISGYAGG